VYNIFKVKEIYMDVIYKNKYGELKLTVDNYVNIKTIFGKDLNENCLFDIAIAEKIALITENKNIQISFFKKDSQYKAYVVHHKSSDTVSICQIKELNFINNVNPQKEIEKIYKETPKLYI